jgi:hypothetical protein
MFDNDTIIERPGSSREAILVYGREGCGKSVQVFSIARHTRGSRFFVIDNDDAPSYMLGLETIFEDLDPRFTVTEIDRADWQRHLEVLERYVADGTEDDWLVVDSATPMWDAAQEDYTAQVFGKDMADFFLDARMKLADNRTGKKGDKLETFDGWKDWTVIKAQYRRFQSLVRQWPGHVYLTCETKSVGDMDDKTGKKVYGPMGAKPAGQKEIGHTTRTILLFERSGNEWTMSTVKDRYRDILEDEAIGDFALDYLRDVGGWREVGGAVDRLAAAKAAKAAKAKGE